MRYSNLIRCIILYLYRLPTEIFHPHQMYHIISLSLPHWDIPTLSDILYHISISYLMRYSNLFWCIISYLYLLATEIFQPYQIYHIISLSLTYWDILTLSDVSYHISISYLMRYSYLIRNISDQTVPIKASTKRHAGNISISRNTVIYDNFCQSLHIYNTV